MDEGCSDELVPVLGDDVVFLRRPSPSAVDGHAEGRKRRIAGENRVGILKAHADTVQCPKRASDANHRVTNRIRQPIGQVLITRSKKGSRDIGATERGHGAKVAARIGRRAGAHRAGHTDRHYCYLYSFHCFLSFLTLAESDFWLDV